VSADEAWPLATRAHHDHTMVSRPIATPITTLLSWAQEAGTVAMAYTKNLGTIDETLLFKLFVWFTVIKLAVDFVYWIGSTLIPNPPKSQMVIAVPLFALLYYNISKTEWDTINFGSTDTLVFFLCVAICFFTYAFIVHPILYFVKMALNAIWIAFLLYIGYRYAGYCFVQTLYGQSCWG